MVWLYNTAGSNDAFPAAPSCGTGAAPPTGAAALSRSASLGCAYPAVDSDTLTCSTRFESPSYTGVNVHTC